MIVAVKKLLAEFQKENTKFQSVCRWRNTLKGGEYEALCLWDLAQYCVKFNTNPDKLVADRIRQLKSTDPRIRLQAEDRLLAYHKFLAKKSSGAAINAYRRIKSFYGANYVSLECRDPGYTVQREQDYLPTREEIRKICELVSLEAKAYLLILAESCGRTGAVAELTWADIRNEINSEIVPCQIWLQHKVKMARKKYFSFICGDAKEALQLVISRRKRLLPTTKVFSKHYNALRKEIVKASAEIGIYNPNEKLNAFRLHCLRKRGQTLLERAHVPLNWVDRILGHVPRGSQGKTYSLPDMEAMRSEYAKAMEQLTIYNVATPVYSGQQETLRQIVRQELQKLLASASTEQLLEIQKRFQ